MCKAEHFYNIKMLHGELYIVLPPLRLITVSQKTQKTSRSTHVNVLIDSLSLPTALPNTSDCRSKTEQGKGKDSFWSFTENILWQWSLDERSCWVSPVSSRCSARDQEHEQHPEHDEDDTLQGKTVHLRLYDNSSKNARGLITRLLD